MCWWYDYCLFLPNKNTIHIANERLIMSSTQVLTKAKMLTAKGDYERAEQLIMSVLVKFPKNKSANQHLVKLAKKRANKFGHAIEVQTDQLMELIKAYEKQDHETSVKISESLKQLYPEKFIIWMLNAVSKRFLKDYNGAFESFERALRIDPENAELHYEIGLALQESGDNKNAFKSFYRSKLLNAKDGRPDNAIGLLYSKAQKYEQALEYYERSIKCDPRESHAYNNASLSCNELRLLDQSEKYVDTAIKLEPEVPEFYFNKAFVLALKCRPNEALEEHDIAVNRANEQNRPKLIEDFRFNDAIISLSSGLVDRGWESYRHRFESKDFPSRKRAFDRPRLENFEQAKGKKILIWSEQGLGDEFMFLNLAKYFQQVTDCTYIMEGSFRVTSLIERAFPNADVRIPLYDRESDTMSTTAKDYDYHMPYGHFPVLLNLKENDEHMIKCYLKADPELVNYWDAKLPKKKIRVGFSWRSQLNTGIRQALYTKLNLWEELVANDKYAFVSLQYGDISNDLNEIPEDFKKKIYMPEVDLKNDLENVAAIMEACDIIVAPQNAVLQQAAALGKTTITHTEPHGWTFLGRKQIYNKSSRHPFLTNNHTICYENTDQWNGIPKLVEEKLEELF